MSPWSRSSAAKTRADETAIRMKRLAAAGAALLLALAMLALGIRAPFEKDQEPLSVQWMRDMAEHGHWLVPRDEYGLASRKPPLFYWLSASVVNLSGGELDEVRARVVSLVAAAAIAAQVLAWGSAIFGEAVGWLGFLFLRGSYGFAARATLALTDMLLTLFIFSAWHMLYRQLEAEASLWRALAIGFVLGLGVLTKGPVAIVLCALGASIYLLLTHRNPLAPLASIWPWALLAVSVAIAALWYVPALAGTDAHLWKIQLAENFGHFAPASLGGTGEAARPIYYILLRLAGGLMPLTMLAPALCVALGNCHLAPEVRKPLLYQASLVLAVVLFFSLASAKRDDYILPAIPPLAILFASLFAPALKGRERGKLAAARLRDGAAGLVAAAMAVGVLGALIYFRAGGKVGGLGLHLRGTDFLLASLVGADMRALSAFSLAFTLCVLAGAAVVLWSLWRRATLFVGGGLALLSLAGVILFTGYLRPRLARLRTLGPFAAEVERQTRGAPVYIVSGQNYELSLYLHRPLRPVLDKGSHGLPQGTAYLVAWPSELTRLGPEARSRLLLVERSAALSSKGSPALYRVEAADRESGLNRPLPLIKNKSS